MAVKRRDLLIFMGVMTGAIALGALPRIRQSLERADEALDLPFEPIQGPMPLPTEAIAGMKHAKAYEAYQTYAIADDLVLPRGFTYDVVATWGDPLGDSRVGYNNDYLAFVATGEDSGYLTANFEYISAKTWMQTYASATGESLEFDQAIAAIATVGGSVDVGTLPEDNPLRAQCIAIAKAALADQGIGVLSLKRDASGKWQHTPTGADRRISGISGWEDNRYLKSTGPAVAIFEKTSGQGYIDGLGARIIGTFGNCAGGQTPWGTVLSAEENFQAQVPEPVYADGTSLDPSIFPFVLADGRLYGQGNPFRLAGNKYGWIVEVDPANPNDFGTKHTWLGRYRHEAVGVRAIAGKPLAFYSGCDRKGGHLYKFVSREEVNDPTDKANSKLLEAGQLYAARFNPDGTGEWIALTPNAAIDPILPSHQVGNLVRLPRHPKGIVTEDGAVNRFKQQFATLGDLYLGNAQEKQGAILIDAHLAANAVGATATARPEDTDIAPDGTLYISFTAGSASAEGGPDRRIFRGPNGETPYAYGWIMQLNEAKDDPAAEQFNWEMVALGGEPASGGAGFANPDNLLVDRHGHLWMVTDISTGKQNRAVPSRQEGKDLSGVFGSNGLWFLPTSGKAAGTAALFATGPVECELTGPCFTDDARTLFLSIQHPGEANGQRQNRAAEPRKFELQLPDGMPFLQVRTVPLGSNWPGKTPNDVPKPAIVAVHRTDAQPIS